MQDLGKLYFLDLCEVVWGWLCSGEITSHSAPTSLSLKWSRCDMRQLDNGNLVFELVKRETKSKPFRLGW